MSLFMIQDLNEVDSLSPHGKVENGRVCIGIFLSGRQR